ncbi:HPP family protein [Desulfonatronum thioautotrophicum]|uniref:HPP family protein n=1 Tax=Desulfonatronum thioautotrophicum TaxID=617001 RepID=UPI0005EB3A88|nr:HPP family protein [Desulfonatronum thioautotrophicum]
MKYFKKMRGTTQSPPRVSLVEVMWSWIGAFFGIAAVGLIHTSILDQLGLTLVLGSLGATAVLVFGAVRSPLAQPRNVLGGHVFSALIGVFAHQTLGTIPWLAGAAAVATAVAVMHLTKTLHPPGGATALIAVVGGDSVHGLGYLYVFVPTGLGAALLLFIALVVNNIPKNRRYPEYWL